MPRTFEHHTHDSNLLVVAHSGFLDFNSQSPTSTATTKSAKHFKTLNGGGVAAAAAA